MSMPIYRLHTVYKIKTYSTNSIFGFRFGYFTRFIENDFHVPIDDIRLIQGVLPGFTQSDNFRVDRYNRILYLYEYPWAKVILQTIV